MTKQTEFANSLVGSSAGVRISRLCTLTITAILAIGAVNGLGQQPKATSSEQAAKPAAQEKKAPAPPAEKVVGNYAMHSSIELGGVISQWDGSSAMWATMVNEGTGMRMLSQSLEMRTVNPSKTPFFDTFSTSSFGYGGEPNNMSYLKLSKGKLYDFSGSFRRDRNYYDYNLMPNSLLSTATPLHRPWFRSRVHCTSSTPSGATRMCCSPFSLSRGSASAQAITKTPMKAPPSRHCTTAATFRLAQWFRNGLGTYTGGVDFKLAKRTTLSYDQFVAFYRGDTSFQLAPTPFTLSDGTPVSLGVNVLTGPTVTCGTGANKTQNVINGIANPFCSSTID